MITSWLSEKERSISSFKFRVIDISEIKSIENEDLKYLAKELLTAYRDLSFLSKQYKNKPIEILIEYLQKDVFPNPDGIVQDNQIRKNVRQGDFGETLSLKILQDLRNMHVPIYKLRYKFNNNRALFCTDIFAQNSIDDLSEFYYYEVKTKIRYDEEICIIAHNSLKKDIPKESIADFLRRMYHERAQILEIAGKKEEAANYYNLAQAYGELFDKPQDFKHNYEIFLVIDKKLFKEDILSKLNDLPPSVTPLTVSILLVDNLEPLIIKSFESAINEAIKIVQS